ncbi:HipA domain-containing protein [Ramlibacter sp. AW1]|uniref:HipA domain-containing protein n=2 Tax=Ramlibacter aurantiacus TaxID=2801330 RepID=A0A937D4K5_9BURK|nr:HipA domain-containing protein [Ramlibacter aurantiacus]
MRQLKVYLDQAPVGTLSEGEDLWAFEYEEAWAESPLGFDLSPALARDTLRHVDGGTQRPVQWYFDNLLPEELLRQAISREAGIKGEDAFALLEYLGAESAGSLTLLPPGQPCPIARGFKALPDEALSARIGKLPRSTLTADAPKRMSLAGAQHKLLVVKFGEQLYEPAGATPSTHILKPSHPVAAEYPGSVANEFVTMRLAAACGLQVPPVEIRYVPEPVYLVERFDRRVEPLKKGAPLAELQVHRRHIIDACQLLNRARGFKHTGATLESLQHIIERSTNKVATRLQLFRWLVFNIVAGNDDCHLKNLSFFVGADGVRLAPHYDLLATSVWNTRAFADDRQTWPGGPMGFALPAATSFGEVTARSVLEAGRALGVPTPAAQRILREIVAKLPPALAREAAALEERQKRAPDAASRFIGAEARVVRVMQKMVVPEMLKRLGGT